MPQCSVPYCTKMGGHRFPTDVSDRLKWQVAIRRTNKRTKNLWKPGPAAVICSKHFLQDDYKFTPSGRRILKAGAVPSAFDFPKMPKKLKPPRSSRLNIVPPVQNVPAVVILDEFDIQREEECGAVGEEKESETPSPRNPVYHSLVCIHLQTASETSEILICTHTCGTERVKIDLFKQNILFVMAVHCILPECTTARNRTQSKMFIKGLNLFPRRHVEWQKKLFEFCCQYRDESVVFHITKRNHGGICEKHFKKEDFYIPRNSKLKRVIPGRMPSLFLPTSKASHYYIKNSKTRKVGSRKGVECEAYGCKKTRRAPAKRTVRSDSEGSEDEETAEKRKYPRIFYKFPTDAELLKNWLINIRRKGWMPSEKSRICSDHFKEENIIHMGHTSCPKPDAVPTRFKAFPKHLRAVADLNLRSASCILKQNNIVEIKESPPLVTNGPDRVHESTENSQRNISSTKSVRMRGPNQHANPQCQSTVLEKSDSGPAVSESLPTESSTGTVLQQQTEAKIVSHSRKYYFRATNHQIHLTDS